MKKAIKLKNYFAPVKKADPIETGILNIFDFLKKTKEEPKKVEVLNFPEQKPPVVNVQPPIVNLNQDELIKELKFISQNTLREKFQLVDKNGENISLKELFKELIAKISSVGGSSAIATFPSVMTTSNTGINVLSGTSVNGTRTLTSANTWYSVPSTVPTSPYILVVSIENAVGTIRFGFDGTGTPSATNGNQAPSQLTVRLAAGQVVYYASSSANDVVNWTTKII